MLLRPCKRLLGELVDAGSLEMVAARQVVVWCRPTRLRREMLTRENRFLSTGTQRRLGKMAK